MNKIVFEHDNFKVKVRDVIIVLMVLFLLFFMLKGCARGNEDVFGTQIDLADNICAISKSNVEGIEELLEHADLCSDEWFGQLNEYIQILEEQNQSLMYEDELKDFYQLQVKVVDLLKAFKENQNKQTIDDLRPILKDYRKYYDERCVTRLK